MSKKVMIAGYYGAQNTGDEAILTGMIHALQGQGITDITVLSRNPEETKQIHGVQSLYIGRRFDGLGHIYKQLRRTDLFILGGGGLLQDYTSRVVPYWLSRVVMALLARTPVMYYAQGMGPLRTDRARKLVRLISNRVQQITLRDEPSYQLLREVGVHKPAIEVTADPALGIQITSDGRALLEQEGIPLESSRERIAISLRSWTNDEAYLPALIQNLKQLKEKTDAQFIFFPLQYGEDERISERVRQELGGEQIYLIKGRYTPEQMTAMLKEMDGVIAMRLHAIILSAISYVPSFGLVYDPKVLRFMERAQLDRYSWMIEEIAANQVPMLDRMEEWFRELGALKEQMREPVNSMKKLALRNAEIAKQLIK